MRDVKALLKEARDAIKNKQFESALKLCKHVLKEDKDNCTALVFIGVSFQETGQGTKAVVAFKAACKNNPDNPLALSGLVNYYEKNETNETKNELVDLYIALLKVEPNDKKIIEYANKLSELHEFGDNTKIVNQIYDLINSGRFQDISELWLTLSRMFTRIKSVPDEFQKIQEEGLQFLIGNQKTVCTELYANYLSFLYKQGKIGNLLEHAKKMHELFELDWVSLRWICKIFNERFVETGNLLDNSQTMTQYYQALLKLEKPSPTALFTKSILLFIENKIIEAKDLLNEIVQLLPGILHAWILLLKCCTLLHFNEEAVTAWNKINKFLQSPTTESRKKLKNSVNLYIVEGFSKSDDKESLEKVLEIYETFDDDTKALTTKHIIRVNITLKRFNEAQLLLNGIKSNLSEQITYKLLSAQLLHKEGKYLEALDLLQDDDIELAEWWIEVGNLYWDMQQKDKSLIPYLKSAKLDPTNYKCFLLLGHYYKFANDTDKARRCYEKAFKLNCQSSETGIELSEIYRKLKNWDGNLKLLQSLTGNVINSRTSWAWLELGLHYLDQEDYDKAINSLRYVSRVEKDNLHCWESLADAYLAKGAFTASLKCYERCAELSSDDLYSKLQIATIKQVLGEYSEAHAGFEEILASNKSYVLALKGMGETCIAQAWNYYNQQRYGTARDCAQKAADNFLMYQLALALLDHIILGSPNYKLAQHALIKSVKLNNNNAVAWCNLGTMYLILGDFKLSNEAFSQAQRADPNYVNSWIGQALLAENFEHEDAMDLFRHSTQLGMHQQGALGYGHWVCKTLKEAPIDAVIYSIHNMHAVPLASDFLSWYTEKSPSDSAAWNMVGMLRERLGLKSSAMDAYRNALALCDEKNRDKGRINYGRALIQTGDYLQAIKVYNSVDSANVNSGAGLALALFKNRQFKESYEAYESALHFLTDEETFQSDLLVALASMAYMFDGPEAATTLLYQSIQLGQPSPFGYYATLALGLLHDDMNLSSLIFAEMKALKDRNDCSAHYAILCGYFHLLQGDSQRAVREIIKLVHCRPDQAPIWLALASFLVRAQKETKAAAKCAQVALKLGQANMDVTKVLCLVSLSSSISGDRKSALIAAQKAVHCYPNLPEAWAVFASALAGAELLQDGQVVGILKYVKSVAKSEKLSEWAQGAIRSFIV